MYRKKRIRIRRRRRREKGCKKTRILTLTAISWTSPNRYKKIVWCFTWNEFRWWRQWMPSIQQRKKMKWKYNAQGFNMAGMQSCGIAMAVSENISPESHKNVYSFWHRPSDSVLFVTFANASIPSSTDLRGYFMCTQKKRAMRCMKIKCAVIINWYFCKITRKIGI